MLLCLLLCFPKEHKQKLILLFLRLFLLALVEHISQVFHRAPSPTQDDYISRTSGEVPSQIFPNFPILKERAIYEKNCHNQDKRALKDSCEKDFPTHSGLTPGLYLMTCGCKQRSVYGFSMMLTHESPSMLFDIITTRFESDYNPHIIYDASCLAMEYGYNRELKRFMSLNITTDRFHEANHKTCSQSFKSSVYNSLRYTNTEACEQSNSALRRVTSSTTYMSPMIYLRSLTLFLADFNLTSNSNK